MVMVGVRALYAFVLGATIGLLCPGASAEIRNPAGISTLTGDCAAGPGYGSQAITCTKTGGATFAPSATTDTTNASNISSGTLNAGRLPAVAPFSSSPANPTGTASTTPVMMGLAGSITPTSTGKVLIVMTGAATNDTAGSGATIGIRYGTGTAPANGAALAGTMCGNTKPLNRPVAASAYIPYASSCVATMTAGQAYWIDQSLAAQTSGTASTVSTDIVAVEVK